MEAERSGLAALIILGRKGHVVKAVADIWYIEGRCSTKKLGGHLHDPQVKAEIILEIVS